MNCHSAREQITDALAAGHAELTGELTGHVQSCASCRTFYAQQGEIFRAMDSGLGAMVNESVPPSLLPRVRARMGETHTVSPWFYRLLPVAAVLVIVCVIAFPLVRHGIRSGGVRVAVIPKPGENGAESRPPLAGRPTESTVLPVTREPGSHLFARPSAAQRPAQSAEAAILVSSEESQGLLQLAAAVPRDPRWAQAMVHPAPSTSSQTAPIEPVEIANLEINPLSEEIQ